VSFELVKIVCTAVVQERDEQGSIIGEQESPPAACYSLAQLVEFRSRAESDVLAANAKRAAEPKPTEAGVAAALGNRAARRRSSKTKPKAKPRRLPPQSR
jgi:hypothetical protein